MAKRSSEFNQLKADLMEAIKKVYSFCGIGSELHIVLDDGNVEEHHITWCMERFPQIEDGNERLACEECAALLLKLPRNARRHVIEKFWAKG